MKSQILQHCANCAAYHASMSKIHRTAAAKCEDGSAMETFHKGCADVHMGEGERYLKLHSQLSADSSVDTHDDSVGTDSIKVKAGRSDDMTKFFTVGRDEAIPSEVSLVLPARKASRGQLIARPGESLPDDDTAGDTETVDQFAKSPDEIRKAMLQG